MDENNTKMESLLMKKIFRIYAIFCFLTLYAISLEGQESAKTVLTLKNILVINEFMAGNTKTIKDPQGQYDDWIELYNTADSTVSLKGLYLTGNRTTIKKWKIPDTTIAPHGYLLIWADNDSNSTPGLHANFKLNLGGEFLGLYDSDINGNAVLDSLTYKHQYDDVSYGRQPNGSGAFLFHTFPTPNAANVILDIDLRSKIVINEIMATNTRTIVDEQSKFADWIELYNKTDSALSLWGTSLSDDPQIPAKWMFPDVVIVPHGYLMVWTDNDETDQPSLHANFRLDGQNGEYIGLYSITQSTVTALDSITFGPQKPDTSIGRYPDGSDTFLFFPNATPGKENKLFVSSSLKNQIVINEVMAANTKTIYDPQGQYDDWIELYNKTDSTVSLKGKYLTDDPDATMKWKFPEVSIASHGYLMIWADDDTTDTPGVHANFKLSKDGEFIGVYDDSSRGNGLIDSISFGVQRSDTSYGRAPDGGNTLYYFPKPSPNKANAIPTSVEEETAIQPDMFHLYQNYPNPFNQGTVITYQLPRISFVKLRVFNMLGQEVKTLVNEQKNAGNYSVRWDGTNDNGTVLSSGIYMYRIDTNTGYTKSAKMLILK